MVDTMYGPVREVVLRHPLGISRGGVVKATGLTSEQVGRALAYLGHKKDVRYFAEVKLWALDSERNRRAYGSVTQSRPCVVCGAPHASEHIGDRMHAICRDHVESIGSVYV